MEIINDMKSIVTRSEIPVFLSRWNLNGVVAEVGVRYGYNLRQLLGANPGVLVGVDIWQAGKQQDTNLNQKELDIIYQDVLEMFWNYPQVKIIKMEGNKAAGLFPRNWVDYAYLDADHTYDYVSKSIRTWWTRIRQGGILAGHDYIEGEAVDGTKFGVVEAVRDFMKEKKIDSKYLHSTKEGWRSWMLYKMEGE